MAWTLLDEVGKDSANLNNKLTELALIQATQTDHDGGLSDIFENGGCILIEGSPNNDTALTLMKMIFVRVIQMASNRDDKSLPVNLWLDECKYLLCQAVVNALGTVRDKNCRLFLTNQSHADFEAVSMQYPSSAIREIVEDNTPFKAAYATRNRETANWIAEHCGTTEGVSESSSTYVNELATEVTNGERKITTIEEPIFHPNLIQNLPRGLAILSGVVSWPTLISIPHISVEKVNVPIFKAPQLSDSQKSLISKEDLL